MPNILCIYYSRTGTTEKLVQEVAKDLRCDMVKLEDGVDRAGLLGWLRCGMQAMARKVPPVKKPETKLPLAKYDLVILATPVWAGRCSAPMRSFLTLCGNDLNKVAYLITRGSDVRYEEIFDQMDMYVKEPRVEAATIRPGTVGSDFWKEEFLRGIREAVGEGACHAG